MLMMMLHRRFRPKSISLPKVFSLLTILKVPSPLVAHQCSGGSLVLYLWIYILRICQTCEGSLPSAVGAGVVGFPKTAPLGINNRAADTNADQVKEGKREECEYLRMSNRVSQVSQGSESQPRELQCPFLLLLFPQLLINDSSGFPAFPSGNQHHCATTINKGNSVKKKLFWNTRREQDGAAVLELHCRCVMKFPQGSSSSQ